MTQLNKLGEIFSWDCDKVSVDREELKLALRGKHLPILPPQRKQGTSLKNVLSMFVHDGSLIRVGETNRFVCYAIVEELRDLAIGEYRGRTIDAVTYWKKTDRVQFRRNLWLEPIIRKAMQERNSVMTGQEIGLSIGKILPKRAYGVKIRRHGGTYFVPEKGWLVLDRIQQVFAKVKATPHPVRLVRFDVFDTKQNRKMIRNVADIALTKQINDQIISLVMFLRSDRKTMVRKNAVTVRVNTLKRLLKTIELYESLLQIKRLYSARASYKTLRKLVLRLQHIRIAREAARC